jgi:hypothetical protein
MDQKHPILLILMVTLFGIAIAGAIWIFGERDTQIRRDTIISGIQHIAANAVQYRFRPVSMGGGGGSYALYRIPEKLASGELAKFEILKTSSPDTLIILATEVSGIGTVAAGVDPAGAVSILKLTGNLAH